MMNNDEVLDDCSIGGESKENLDSAHEVFLKRYQVFERVREEMRRQTTPPGRTFQGAKI